MVCNPFQTTVLVRDTTTIQILERRSRLVLKTEKRNKRQAWDGGAVKWQGAESNQFGSKFAYVKEL